MFFSLYKKIDWALILSVIALMVAGLLSLFSSSPDLFYKQIIWISIGLIFVVAIIFIDMRSFFSRKSFIYWLYFLSIIVLVATYFIATEIKGNRAWIVFGPFQIQPSEFAKVVLIILLSYFFSKKHIGIALWRTIAVSFVYFAIPAFLIAMQPDMGSVFVLFLIWLGFVVVAGLPFKRFLAMSLIFLILFSFMWIAILKDYQKARILGVVFPQRDTVGVNYSAAQSKIAIGNGGFFGKGVKQGTQVQLGFLPDAQTDFIFSAIAEEGGIFASAIICIIFLLMTTRILKVGSLMDGNFYKFLCLGAVIMFFAQFAIHVGANLGFFPVIGITLPFVSYGGSSVVAGLILIGIIQSAYARR